MKYKSKLIKLLEQEIPDQGLGTGAKRLGTFGRMIRGLSGNQRGIVTPTPGSMGASKNWSTASRRQGRGFLKGIGDWGKHLGRTAVMGMRAGHTMNQALGMDKYNRALGNLLGNVSSGRAFADRMGGRGNRGQQPNPQAPSTPQTPSAPQTPPTPQAPSTSQTPPNPQAPSVPQKPLDFSRAYDVKWNPSFFMAKGSQTPQTAQTPQAPQTSQALQAPQIPQIAQKKTRTPEQQAEFEKKKKFAQQAREILPKNPEGRKAKIAGMRGGVQYAKTGKGSGEGGKVTPGDIRIGIATGIDDTAKKQRGFIKKGLQYQSNKLLDLAHREYYGTRLVEAYLKAFKSYIF